MGIETIVTQPKGEIKVETALFHIKKCNPPQKFKGSPLAESEF